MDELLNESTFVQNLTYEWAIIKSWFIRR